MIKCNCRMRNGVLLLVIFCVTPLVFAQRISGELRQQWVDHGKAPDQIIASHSTGGKVDRTRPLCAYPQVAKYKGSGSIDDAANFACMAP